jgi:hypothetical protein
MQYRLQLWNFGFGTRPLSKIFEVRLFDLGLDLSSLSLSLLSGYHPSNAGDIFLLLLLLVVVVGRPITGAWEPELFFLQPSDQRLFNIHISLPFFPINRFFLSLTSLSLVHAEGNGHEHHENYVSIVPSPLVLHSYNSLHFWYEKFPPFPEFTEDSFCEESNTLLLNLGPEIRIVRFNFEEALVTPLQSVETSPLTGSFLFQSHPWIESYALLEVYSQPLPSTPGRRGPSVLLKVNQTH